MKRMMEQSNLKDSYQLFQPSQPFLITTRNGNGSLNVAPFSWLTPVSADPPVLALCLLTLPKKQDSLINIERTLEFGVNIPQINLVSKLVKASFNYPPEISKFDALEFTFQEPKVISTGLIEECRVNFECKVKRIELIGDHTLIIADIAATHYDDQYFDADMVLNLEAAKTCHHLKKFIIDEGQKHIFMSDGKKIEVTEYYTEMNRK